ncbi:cyclin-domain-containing protein [Gloeophyllum trabeum ATCC 11539]|uniref:Cyclin-domain-containing protein n=1 Tax=Gloeophyllum trabeum (strain ATCC 11539 / FP-39264 / Madison 617) TaxID=670483 RepID=S7S1P2_GLOTA|nr:cyclin-domain-containing protein [Gloeophyllum trabeum ATCC 11539]EPQ59689.1 cyclin-domain-containing protein [Gloeophyllum trabeum ATCC 11539]
MLALAPALQHNPSDSHHRAPSVHSSGSSSRPSRPLPRKAASSSTSTTYSSASSSSTTPSASRASSVASSPPQSHRIRPPLQTSSSSSAASTSHSRTASIPVGGVGPPAKAPSVEHSSAKSGSSPAPSQSKTPETKADSPGFDIHTYPSTDLLKLLASLLTQIAATNDALGTSSPTSPTFQSHSRSSSVSDNAPHSPVWDTLTTASKTALSVPSSSLAFHARNIPTISLEAYLLRILKYCPTTNEVFLSLLVYFDRMSKLTQEATGKTFVIDSYNIHRLVIAGVTVASKFFSDVFYTNSRYAKVGGLPQAELNQLELQFLLLNNFNLMITPDEMQRYAEQLIIFSQSPSQQNRKDPCEPTPLPLTVSDTRPAAPMQAMGAVDTYGDHVGSCKSHASPAPPRASEGSEADHPSKTPNVRPQVLHRGSSSGASTHSRYSSVDSASEAGDTETEYDGETDDEPTIRPNGSDTQSLYSVGSVDDRDDSMGSP